MKRIGKREDIHDTSVVAVQVAAVLLVERVVEKVKPAGMVGMLMLFVDKLLTCRCLERELFVILNTIGCGLLPKRAGFRFKEQAILPKQG